MTHWLGNSARGFCMGLADVIPGVSGGTVALILGIYPRLINAVGSLGAGMIKRVRTRSFRTLLKMGFRDPSRLGNGREGVDAGHLLLLASIVAGVVPAIALGARVLPPLLSSHPAEMRGLFLGLVAASVMIPLREIQRRSPSRWLLSLGATLAAAWFVGMSAPVNSHATGTVSLELAAPPATDVRLTPGNLTLIAPGDEGRPGVAYGVTASRTVPAGAASVEVEIVARRAGSAGNAPAGSLEAEESPVQVASVSQPAALGGGRNPSLAYVFLGGVLAISAMSLPGLSGAFVLLLLGLYHFVVHSLSLVVYYRDLSEAAVVVTMVAGMVVGLLTFARVLKHLFSKWRDGTLAVLVGLMLGSLRKLWPFVDHTAEGREIMTLPAAGDPGVAIVAVMFAVGIGAVLFLDAAGRRRA